MSIYKHIPAALKLRHLDAFLAVAEAGTISAAAKARNVSQPAFSKTISELEMHVGAPLFERTGRRAILTSEGEMFRRHAMAALQSVEAGVRSVSGSKHTDLVKVGVLPTVAGGLFPTVALDFTNRHPEARIGVITGPNHFLIERLREGKIDLMVGRMPSERHMPGLSFEHLYDEPIQIVGRAGHPGLDMPVVEALTEFPVILPNPGAIIRALVDQYLSAMGLTDLRPRFETVALPVALKLLERSDMLWFISKGVVEFELESGTLAAIDPKAEYLSGAVGLTRKFDFIRNSPADLLAGLLHQRAAEMTTR